MEFMNGPTDDDYSQVIIVPPFWLHQSCSLARTTGTQNPERDRVLDYVGHATMSGNSVEAIFFCAGQVRRISTLVFPPCICAYGVRVDELHECGSHFSIQDNARFTLRMFSRWACFGGRLCQTPPRGLIRVGILLTPHWPYHLNRNILIGIII